MNWLLLTFISMTAVFLFTGSSVEASHITVSVVAAPRHSSNFAIHACGLTPEEPLGTHLAVIEEAATGQRWTKAIASREDGCSDTIMPCADGNKGVYLAYAVEASSNEIHSNVAEITAKHVHCRGLLN